MSYNIVDSSDSGRSPNSSDTCDSVPARSKNPMYYTRESSYELDWIRSSMRKSDLKDLRRRYDIPNSIIMRLPKKGEKASEPRNGEVAVFEVFFELGVRFPLQAYFVKMLSGLNLAPCQLILNSWRILVGLYVLWRKTGHEEPNSFDCRRLYHIRTGAKSNPGFFYLAARSKDEKPIPDCPDSNKSWKDRWFFIGGDWGHSITVGNMEFSVPTNFSSEAFRGERPLLDSGLEDEIQEILAESRVTRELFSDFSLKETGLIASIPEIKRRGMVPKVRKGKKKKKKVDPEDTLKQLSALLGSSTLEICSIEIPSPPELSTFENLNPPLERLTGSVLNSSPIMVVPDPVKKKKRKVGMSVEGSSSTSLHVIDITSTKRDRYEHLVPIIKSMEHSVPREWANAENRADDFEILGLCSELSHKLNFLLAGSKDRFGEHFKGAQRSSVLERENEILKKEKEKLEARVLELLKEKEEVKRESEKKIYALTSEKNSLQIRITDFDMELAAAIQAQKDIRKRSATENYVKGFSDTVVMFKSRLPYEDLSFLDKGLEVANRLQEDESEDEDKSDDGDESTKDFGDEVEESNPRSSRSGSADVGAS